MIAEKTNTAQLIIDKISASAGKVNFIDNTKLSKALLFLENNGIPTNKHEDYKYCNIDGIFKKEFKNIQQHLIEINDVSDYKLNDALNIVIVNGNFSETLSDKLILKGLHLNTFSNLNTEGKNLIASIADVESDAFIALNTAFCGEGFHLKINDNEQLQIPIHILYVSSATSQSLVNPRNIIELGVNAEATIIEQQLILGSEKIFTNFLSEKFINENAKLTSYTIQNEGENGFSVNTNQVKIDSNGKYENTTITLSGSLVRNNHNIALAGQNCEANLNGLFSTKSNQLVDNHTLMDHQKPHCQSSELYKGIINDKSTGVFNGKIFVKEHAQKTNAYQSSKNILLSDDASISTKPQLEIYADDVKCSHGTSTGKIDETAIFYLNARGIGRETAKKLLLNAFAQEIINKVEIEELREKIMNLFEHNL